MKHVNTTKPRYFIKTFGCQMNLADSDYFACFLEDIGFERVESPVECDVVIVNTCVVRAKAEDKAISYLGELESLRKQNRNLRVILAGCLAPLTDEIKLRSRFPSIKIIINPADIDSFKQKVLNNIHELVDMPIDESSFDIDIQASDNLLQKMDFRFHEFINVMRGCEQNCTFCIVPRTRGKNYSRSYTDIVDEVKQARESGAKAITLLGQSIMDYGKDWIEGKSVKSIKGDEQFRQLLDSISAEFPDLWIKFLTSHPKDCTFETIDLIASRDNISKFLHLPIQSGDNTILKRMGRGHTREYYLELADYAEDKIPDLRLSSDIIVGFPGEGEAEFENSMDLLRQIRFFKVFTFQYSPRYGTPAEKFDDNVPIKTKRQRLNRLIELQNQITLERHQELVGSEVEVMIEGAARSTDKKLMGRSLNEDIVLFNGVDNLRIGELVRISITEARQRTLIGKLIEK